MKYQYVEIVNDFLYSYDFSYIEDKINNGISFYYEEDTDKLFHKLDFNLFSSEIINNIILKFHVKNDNDLLIYLKKQLYFFIYSIVLKIVEENRVK